MNNKLFLNVKRTMSNYTDNLEDRDIALIINQLRPYFKEDLLSKIPTIKEIDDDLANLSVSSPEISIYANGLAQGAKNIIKLLIL